MADDFDTCPGDVYEDERLMGARLSTITGHAAVMLLADDHGLFDGHVPNVARRWGCSTDEAEALFDELEERKLVRFYDAPGRGGVTRRVGKVIDFHAYRGHPHRVKYPAKRGASAFPLEDGASVPSRRARAKPAPQAVQPERGSNVEAPWNARGSDVEASWNERGTDVARAGTHAGTHARVYAGTHAGTRAQHSTEQHSEAGDAPQASPQRSSKPSPAGSTDARASDAGPVDVVASASGLGGPAAAPMGVRRRRPDHLARERAPPPSRSDYASPEGYEAARQAWLAGASAHDDAQEAR